MQHSALKLAAVIGAAVLGLWFLGAASEATVIRGRAHVQIPATRTFDAMPQATKYTFTTLDDQADPAFNQLLGINNSNVICGYFGIGSSSSPNKGYVLNPPYSQSDYVDENFPGSVQTQVTAINGFGYTGGFYINASGENLGFLEWNGVFTSYRDPKTGKGTVNQVLGVNDDGTAVGFYSNAKGVNFGFSLKQKSGKFAPIVPPDGSNVMATGISNKGAIVGSLMTTSGGVAGFLDIKGSFTEFEFPNSTNTTPLGVNDHLEIVGVYVDSHGLMHGFTVKSPTKHAKWQSIDDPNGVGTTTVNGLNDAGDLVGFYVDSTGNTDGFLAVPPGT